MFVDGCFWHGCPLHYTAPKTNSDFWLVKLDVNRERDARADAQLRELGWRPVRIWEHVINADIDEAVSVITAAAQTHPMRGKTRDGSGGAT